MGGRRISVIVPAYNIAPYLGRCLDSLLAQTHVDLEIIVVDDGSKDGTGAILEAYQQEVEKLQARAAAVRQVPPPEKESIKGQLEAGAKKAEKEKAAHAPKEKPAKAAER